MKLIANAVYDDGEDPKINSVEVSATMECEKDIDKAIELLNALKNIFQNEEVRNL